MQPDEKNATPVTAIARRETTAIALRGDTYQTGTEFVHALVDLRQQGAIVLAPVTYVQQPPQWYDYALTVVQISLEIRAGECWRDPRWPEGDLALTHKGLAKLWNAAGGEWEWTSRQDDGKHPFISEMMAKGSIKDLEGNSQSAIKRARIDYRDNQPQVAGWSDKQLMEARKKITERSESMAQNRVIRELLNVRNSYHRDELEFPFILAKLVFRPDTKDPDVKRAYIERGLGSNRALFGPSPTLAFPPTFQYQIPSSVAVLDDAEPEPPPDVESPAAPANAPVVPSPAAPAVAPTQDIEQKVMDFQAADASQQVMILKAWMLKKGYEKELKRPLEQFDAEYRIEFLRHLLSMPNRTAA